MYIDMTFFGYGVAVVMVGWVAGLVVSFFFEVMRRAGRVL